MDGGRGITLTPASIRTAFMPEAPRRPVLTTHVRRGIRLVVTTARDIGPTVIVIVFFQAVVLRRPFPDLEGVLAGAVLAMAGLLLFTRGLEIGLFPLGQSLADAFVRKGSLTALLAFAFALGFGTTVAEPALIAIAGEAAARAEEAGLIVAEGGIARRYALAMRVTVAVAVGLALVIGVVRIVKGWPIQYLIVGGYLAVVVLTPFAPREIVGVAYDSGGVTTSTVTVPLVAALGVGLASAIRGRSPLVDGFGLIAFASLTPMIFVMAFGILWHGH